MACDLAFHHSNHFRNLVNCKAIIAFFKGNRLGLIFSIIGSHIMWIALLAFLLLRSSRSVQSSSYKCLCRLCRCFAFLIAGFTYIVDAFRK